MTTIARAFATTPDLLERATQAQPLVLESLQFDIPGEPVGKGRPRAFRRGNVIAMHTPDKTASYENRVAHCAMVAMAGRPVIEVAVAVELEIRLPVAESWSGKKKRAALAGEILPTKKPDIDNVEKALFDAMNQIVWRDDVQVVDVVKRKRYSDRPGVTVTVFPKKTTGG